MSFKIKLKSRKKEEISTELCEVLAKHTRPTIVDFIIIDSPKWDMRRVSHKKMNPIHNLNFYKEMEMSKKKKPINSFPFPLKIRKICQWQNGSCFYVPTYILEVNTQS